MKKHTTLIILVFSYLIVSCNKSQYFYSEDTNRPDELRTYDVPVETEEILGKGECKYYSYLVHSPRTYMGLKIYASSAPFLAAFDNNKITSFDNLEIINIGPFDTQEELEKEIQTQRAQIEFRGKRRTVRTRYNFGVIWHFNNVPCKTDR